MEYVFRRPAFLTTCVYALYGVFIVSILSLLSRQSFIATSIQGWMSAGSVAFGECTYTPFAQPRPC